MESQKVAVIAPKEPMQGYELLPNLQDEINIIVKHHKAETRSDVTTTNFLQLATGDEYYDIYHFAGHMVDEGFVANESIIPFSTLVIGMKTAQPKLVVFSSCESSEVAERISSLTGSDCIYSLRKLYDDRALTFSIVFYKALRKKTTTSYRQAFDAANPMDDALFYVDGKREELEDRSILYDEKRMEITEREIGRLNTVVGELQQAIYELRSELKTQAAIQAQRDENTKSLIDALRRQVELSATNNSLLSEIARKPANTEYDQEMAKSFATTANRLALSIGGMLAIAIAIAYVLFK